jgi:hypothetical protein
MRIGDVLGQILAFLGIKESKDNKYEVALRKLDETKALNHDKIGLLKEQIGVLERRAQLQKKEYDQAHGPKKKIVEGEIERTLNELDRLHERNKILGSNIDKLDKFIAKIEELKAAQDRGVEEEDVDTLAVDLDDEFADLKDVDKAVDDLEKIIYRAPQERSINAVNRFRDIEGASEEDPSESTLPEATVARLKALAAEGD